jgi:hypothetical protein
LNLIPSGEVDSNSADSHFLRPNKISSGEVDSNSADSHFLRPNKISEAYSHIVFVLTPFCKILQQQSVHLHRYVIHKIRLIYIYIMRIARQIKYNK